MQGGAGGQGRTAAAVAEGQGRRPDAAAEGGRPGRGGQGRGGRGDEAGAGDGGRWGRGGAAGGRAGARPGAGATWKSSGVRRRDLCGSGGGDGVERRGAWAPLVTAGGRLPSELRGQGRAGAGVKIS